MMREILFRGRTENKKKWFEGYYTLHGYKIGTIEEEIYPTITPFNDWQRKVDPKTVGQFTGLNDKNGKKIFEGDILQFLAYGTVYTGKVEFLNGAFWVKCRFHDRIGAIVYEFKPEIIGNIYDNPELLEGKQ